MRPVSARFTCNSTTVQQAGPDGHTAAVEESLSPREDVNRTQWLEYMWERQTVNPQCCGRVADRESSVAGRSHARFQFVPSLKCGLEQTKLLEHFFLWPSMRMLSKFVHNGENVERLKSGKAK